MNKADDVIKQWLIWVASIAIKTSESIIIPN